MGDPVTYVSLAMAIVSIGTMLYQFGVKNGQVDVKLDAIKDDFEKYPLPEINTQVKLMWDVYVLDALHNRTDLTTHRSPLTITEKGIEMIPLEIRNKLDLYFEKKNHSSTWAVVSCLGMTKIEDLSKQMGFSTALGLALLSVYYKLHHLGFDLNEDSNNGKCSPEVEK